jgi:hypothetical protein
VFLNIYVDTRDRCKRILSFSFIGFPRLVRRPAAIVLVSSLRHGRSSNFAKLSPSKENDTKSEARERCVTNHAHEQKGLLGQGLARIEKRLENF